MVEVGIALVLMTDVAWLWIAGQCCGSAGKIWFGNYGSFNDTGKFCSEEFRQSSLIS